MLMAIMDKKSVREEFERLKSDFDNLSKGKKVSPEIKTLVGGLIMLIEIILSIFLEKKTKKTSENSSKPPSQTEKDESSLSAKGSNGKGKSEHDLLAKNTRTVETTTVIPVNYCDHCGESFFRIWPVFVGVDAVARDFHAVTENSPAFVIGVRDRPVNVQQEWVVFVLSDKTERGIRHKVVRVADSL